jgi:hypothetical protein
VVAALLALPSGRPAEPAPEALAAPSAQRIFVQFRFDAKDARDVALAGTFTDWRPSYPMQRTPDGVWTVVLPITPACTTTPSSWTASAGSRIRTHPVWRTASAA